MSLVAGPPVSAMMLSSVVVSAARMDSGLNQSDLVTWQRIVAVFIGAASVPIYFYMLLQPLIWHFSKDDTLAWIWAFGGGRVILLCLLCVFGFGLLGGCITYALLHWFLRLVFAGSGLSNPSPDSRSSASAEP
jgi:hypothetical protein